VEPGLIGGPAPGGRTSVLVGYGPKTTTARRRPRRPLDAETGATDDRPLADPELTLLPSIPDALHAAAKPVRHGGLEVGRATERAAEEGPAPSTPVRTRRPADAVSAVPAAAAGSPVPVRAKPPVRKLARDLGVDLASIRGTGPNGTITREDLQQASRPTPASTPTTGAVRPGAVLVGGDASRERRVPVRGVRKLTAEAMVASAFTAPHVTEFLTVDATGTMQAVERLKSSPELAEVRVGPLLLVAKALVLAVARHPMINSTWDGDAGEIVVKEYVNLGIAAATPRGLTVPNIKDAGRLSLRQLAEALNELVATAKEGRTAPADMQGGTITITNVGVFGVDGGTPILNPGEAAILCFGQVREQPWVHEGEVRPRQVCQLSLSFDHRIVDGELGSKFLADVGRFLTDPAGTLLAWS